MLARKNNHRFNETTFLVFSFFLLFVFILIRSAWVCDDAYITLRTVDNLYHGHGLTWNPGERLQTYTHPLWMLVIATVYFAEDNPYFILIVTSIGLTIATIYLLISKLSLTTSHAIVGILLMLSSKAFIDYSTSGLENPLTHLIYILFIILFLYNPEGKYSTFVLALIASLGMLCRMDVALLFLPALLYIVLLNRTRRDIVFAFLGFLPLILWELFSLLYYGFLFPNTAYAKLNTGIHGSLLAKQGVLYLLYTLSRDPGSLFIIGLGGYAAIKDRDWRKIVVLVGIVLYLLYVIRIGGGFMAGRFLSVLVVGAVGLIISTELFTQEHSFFALFIALLIIFLATPNPPIMYNAGDSRQEVGVMGTYNGIEDERLWYYQLTGLLTTPRNEAMPRMAWKAEGREAKERKYDVVDRGPVGIFGFSAGPNVHVIDWYALTDPLLARLPVDDQVTWRIGHFFRSIPEGYLETLETDENRVVDPNLAKYYEKLSLITKGDLLDKERLIAIWRMNTGYYQPLLEAYLPPD